MMNRSFLNEAVTEMEKEREKRSVRYVFPLGKKREKRGPPFSFRSCVYFNKFDVRR